MTNPIRDPLENSGDGLTLDALLRIAGPYFAADPVSDDDLFRRLELFGRIVWKVESVTQREAAEQIWIDYLKKRTLLGISQPWRVVHRAILAGRDGHHQSGILAELHGYSDLELLSRPDPVWLLTGFLHQGGLALLVGRWGAGKTFLLLDWAFHVAAGLPWQGRSVLRRPVLYLYAEGSMKPRVVAWRAAHRIAPGDAVGVTFVSGVINLLDPENVMAFLTAMRADRWGPRAGLIVFDTMSRMTPGGDENSPETAGMVIAACDRIQRSTGATVILSHHTPWDKSQQRPRGHTKLPDAADAILLVENRQGALKLSSLKVRDGDLPAPIYLKLTTLNGSLVITDAQAPPQAQTGVDRLVEALSDGEATIDELMKRLHRSRRHIERLLEAAGSQVTKVPGTGVGRRPAKYRATPASTANPLNGGVGGGAMASTEPGDAPPLHRHGGDGGATELTDTRDQTTDHPARGTE